MKKWLIQVSTAVVLIATVMCIAGCPVRLASEYDEVFDKQLVTFQQQYDAFLIKLAMDKPKYCDPASTEFYDGVVIRNMQFLVNRTNVQAMKTAKTPIPGIGNENCKSVPKPTGTQTDKKDENLKLCPLETTPVKDKYGNKIDVLAKKYRARFEEVWQRRKAVVFGSHDLDILKCRCNQKFAEALGDALNDVSLVTLCQLHLLWKSIYRLALDHAISSADNKSLSISQIGIHSRQAGSFFQNLMFLEKEKKAARSVGKDK
ncbi:MAG: hypothetical protein KQI62_07315 [Deltaproteobacteria bacterium]|nr:hypothetical protein [Deltaproteobacteria bacterium]